MSTVKLTPDSGGGSVQLKAPASTSGADVILKLPNTDGNNNQLLKTDGSGNLSWADDTTNTNASNLSSGTLPDARFPATLPAVSGANLTGISSPGSFRNLIINGAMNVAQRGTSGTGNDYKSVDRFEVQFGSHTGVAQAQVALTSSDTGPWEKGFRNCFKVTNASTADETAADAEARITYTIEAQDIASSGWDYTSTSSNLTVSFWAKSNVAETFYLVFRTRDGTNQSYCTPVTLAANTWTKFTKTIPGAANNVINNDNGEGLRLNLYLFLGTNSTTSSHTNNAWAAHDGNDTTPDFEQSGSWFAGDASSTFQITGLQLEAGSTATDFEHRSYGEELLRCQRYYQVDRSTSHNTMYESWDAANGKQFQHNFVTTMRASPTIDYTNGTNGISNSGWSGATPTGHASVDHVLFYHGSTMFHLGGTSNGNIGITYSAEL